MVVVCLLTPDILKIVSAELITLALLMRTKDLALMKCQHSLIPTDQSGWLPKAKPYHHLQVKKHKLNKTMTGPFVESPDNVSGPESCLPCLHSRDQSFQNIENDKKTGLWAMSCATIECFHMTSRQPYSSPKTMKRRPCFCPKPIFWEVYSFLEQTLSFVPINLHRCWPREWKHSIQQVLILKFAFGPEELSCLSRNLGHYSARPMRFWSRGPSEFRLGYVTEMHWPGMSGKTPYMDKANYNPHD